MLKNILDDIAKNINQKEFKLKYVNVSFRNIPELSFFFNADIYIKKGLVINIKVDKVLLEYLKKTEEKLGLSVRESLELLDLFEEFHSNDLEVTDSFLITLQFILESRLKKTFDTKTLAQYLYTTFALKLPEKEFS